MTTLEPGIELPEWEQGTIGYQPLPPADRDNVCDPAYVYARVQEALSSAEQHDREDNLWRERDELIVLKVYLNDLASELRLFSAAGDEFLATLEAIAPEFTWRRSVGFYTFASDEAAAVRYATQLGLREGSSFRSGRVWDGTVEGWKVRIFGPEQQ